MKESMSVWLSSALVRVMSYGMNLRVSFHCVRFLLLLRMALDGHMRTELEVSYHHLAFKLTFHTRAPDKNGAL